MSSVSSRPRVTRLSTKLVQTANTRAQLSCELRQLLVETASLEQGGPLSELVSPQRPLSSTALPVRPLAEMRQEFTELRVRALNVLQKEPTLAPQQAQCIATLAALSQSGYVLDQGTWAPALLSIQNAASPAQAQREVRALQLQVEKRHRGTIEQTLATACARASTAAGFESVRVERGSDGSKRVIAKDQYDRALVSEIHVADEGLPRLATEVVGITDGSCESILDTFDAALETLGVHSDAPVERRATRGVPLTEAARRFVREKLRPQGPVVAPAPAFADEDECSTTTRNQASRNQEIRCRG